jgi:hypothetical protein
VKDLVIFGASAFADIAHYYFSHDSNHRVVAFTVDGAYLEEPTFKGLPVIPFEELAKTHPPGRVSMFVALGIQKVNHQRAERVAAAQAAGYRLTSFLSSKAETWAVTPSYGARRASAFTPVSATTAGSPARCSANRSRWATSPSLG